MKRIVYMPVEFSQRLKQLIDENNITPKELGRELKISSTSIYDWLSDARNITAVYLFELAEYFNVNPSWLYGTSNKKEVQE